MYLLSALMSSQVAATTTYDAARRQPSTTPDPLPADIRSIQTVIGMQR